MVLPIFPNYFSESTFFGISLHMYSTVERLFHQVFIVWTPRNWDTMKLGVCACERVCVCACLRVYVCMCLCECVCMCVHACVCACVLRSILWSSIKKWRIAGLWGREICAAYLAMLSLVLTAHSFQKNRNLRIKTNFFSCIFNSCFLSRFIPISIYIWSLKSRYQGQIPDTKGHLPPHESACTRKV